MKRPHPIEHCSDYPKISPAIKTYSPCSLDNGSKQNEEQTLRETRPKRSRIKTNRQCF